MVGFHPSVLSKRVTGTHGVWGVVCCVLLVIIYGPQTRALGEDLPPSESPVEFSAKLKWRIGGKTSTAQLYVQQNRYRIEHLGGIKTDLGYASVTIVLLDQQKVLYVISQRRLVMAVPLTTDFLLPLSVELEGETSRILLGEAFVGNQPARLFEVVVDREGRQEAYYEWVDSTRNILLKLVSQDRDWSVEYEHVVLSQQPDYFFNPPLGYQTYEAITRQAEKG